jgi:hypothetical protein
MHMVSSTKRDSRRRASYAAVASMRAPVAPTGWPSEMPEPLGFTRSSRWIDLPFGQHGEHLRGERLVEFDEVDVIEGESARFSAAAVAFTGPIPMTSGRSRSPPRIGERAAVSDCAFQPVRGERRTWRRRRSDRKRCPR